MPSKFTHAAMVKRGDRILVEPVDAHAYEARVVDIAPEERNGMLVFAMRRANGKSFEYEIPPNAPVEVRS